MHRRPMISPDSLCGAFAKLESLPKKKIAAGHVVLLSTNSSMATRLLGKPYKLPVTYRFNDKVTRLSWNRRRTDWQ